MTGNDERPPTPNTDQHGLWQASLQPLRSGSFRSAWLATTGLQMAGAIQLIGATWLMVKTAGRPELVATLLAISNVTRPVFSLVGGALADRIDRVQLIMAAQVVMLLASAAGLAASLAFGVTPALLIGVVFVWFSGMAVRTPAYQAFLFSLLPREVRHRGASFVNASFFISRAVAQFLGGVLLFYVDSDIIYVIGIVAGGASILSFAVMARSAAMPRRGVRSDAPTSSLWPILTTRAVMFPIAQSLLLNACGAVVPSLAANLVQDLLRLDSVTYGTLMGTYFLGGTLGGFIFPALPRILGRHWRAALIAIFGATLAGTAAAWSAATVAILLFTGAASLFGVAASLQGQVVLSLQGDDSEGRVLSVFLVATFGGVAIGNVVWGVVAGLCGIGPAYLAAAACAVPLALLDVGAVRSRWT